MKWLFLILSFLFLGLSCVPCSDVHGAAVETYASLSSSDHEQHSDKEDACTPLCTCSCCSYTYASFATAVETNQSPVITNTLTGHTVEPVVAGSNAIWQPPRA
ncbi:DUF6660 family protein [Niabella hibiscisoli]|uniref:DUF6660 family protein n=1 Tax=Niabella hibiscisoli TaxID=1825928 RepID=UPI001F10FEE2|nr:DUF6660 family protein [Niabella hibiscisoli]MCH5717966.1 hypothetical protein [Niabella hibiscisoli]